MNQQLVCGVMLFGRHVGCMNIMINYQPAVVKLNCISKHEQRDNFVNCCSECDSVFLYVTVSVCNS